MDEQQGSGLPGTVQSAVRTAITSVLVKALVYGGSVILAAAVFVFQYVKANPFLVHYTSFAFLFFLGMAALLLFATLLDAYKRGRVSPIMIGAIFVVPMTLALAVLGYELWAVRSDLTAIRTDLDHYVMPRYAPPLETGTDRLDFQVSKEVSSP